MQILFALVVGVWILEFLFKSAEVVVARAALIAQAIRGGFFLRPAVGISEAATGDSLVSRHRSGEHDSLLAAWCAVSWSSSGQGDRWATGEAVFSG